MSDTRTFHFRPTADEAIPLGIRQEIGKIAREHIGEDMALTIAKKRDKASDAQRRYYFAVIVAGYQNYYHHHPDEKQRRWVDKDDMHDVLMKVVGGFKKPFVNPLTGEEEYGRLSWNDLYKQGAESYFTLCRKYAAELKPSFDILEPNEIPAEFYNTYTE